MKKLSTLILSSLLVFIECIGQDCNSIEKKVDKFDNKTTWFSPNDKVTFMKVINNGNESIMVSLVTNGSSVFVGGEGIFILLDDGDKIARDKGKVDVDANISSSGFRYSGFISLNKIEIEIMKNRLITDFRLYIYDESISTEKAKELQEFLNCIIQAN